MKWNKVIVSALFAACTLAQATQTHGFGALLPQESHEVAHPAIGFTPPRAVDLRQWTVPIGDQGHTNSCVAWTVAYAMVGWYANRNHVSDYIYSPMFMYAQINVGRELGFDSGSYPSDALELAQVQGNAILAGYSRPDPLDWKTLPSGEDKADARFHRIKSYTNLFSNPSGQGSGANGKLAIVQALAGMNPVAISMRVRPGFTALSPEKKSHTDTSGSVSGYHEVLAVGYDDAGLLVQNHWGKDWGTDGFGHIAWSVVEKDVFNADTMVPNDEFYNTVYRFAGARKGQHFYTLNHGEGIKAGYRYKGVEWRTLTENGDDRRELFRCNIKSAFNARFISIDPSCEREIKEGSYGYIYNQQFNGTVPLYRYLNKFTGERLVTLNPDEGDPKNFRLEMILGYVTPIL